MKVIILCGGSGSRLWPLSRGQYPKQFVRLADMEYSIFQLTVKRALLLCEIGDVYFVTGEDYKHIMIGQMEEIGVDAPIENFLFEPVPKNTLPAIYYAVSHIRKETEDTVVVFSSDNLIDDDARLAKIIQSANAAAESHLVIFGVRPTAPETAYGYIKPGKAFDGGFLVDSFKEKPDLETAIRYVESGYFWNSGMFMFNTKVFARELEIHNPDVFHAFEKETAEECFAEAPAISIDYGLIEKSDKDIVFTIDVGWNDLGNFSSFYDKYNTHQDENGNVTFHQEIILDGKDNLIYSGGDKAIAMVGLSDMVVVDQKDALLICERGSTGQVREVVDILKSRKDKRADMHVTEYRPWGYFTFLEKSVHYKVMRLTVLPGKQLHAQMHYHRNVHWVVVSGTAAVEIGESRKLLRKNESLYVEAGQVYRLENPGKVKLEIIEVQSGDYLEEDDAAPGGENGIL